MRLALWLGLLAAPALSSAQFAWPKPEQNVAEPGVYTEDPFIIEYRRKFFAVFRGDLKTFEKAYAEIEAMLRKDPKDARALVWYGNGQTVKASVLRLQNKLPEAEALLAKSRTTLDNAVALRPDDPNIYMMRAATLYIQGQYWPSDKVPRIVWERLRDDTERFVKFIGPDRISKVSLHVRGETFGEMGIAYKNLGDKAKAKAAFQRVIDLCPDSQYSARAKREIEALGG